MSHTILSISLSLYLACLRDQSSDLVVYLSDQSWVLFAFCTAPLDALIQRYSGIIHVYAVVSQVYTSVTFNTAFIPTQYLMSIKGHVSSKTELRQIIC